MTGPARRLVPGVFSLARGTQLAGRGRQAYRTAARGTKVRLFGLYVIGIVSKNFESDTYVPS